MVDYTQLITKYDVATLIGAKLNDKPEKGEYAKLDHFCAGLAVLYSMLNGEKKSEGNMTRELFQQLANMELRMASMENQLSSPRVTDSDDIYVPIEEVARLSGYERKRCKQLMVDAIANGDIRVNQVAFINKAGNESHTRCRYHLGDCKLFWHPGRVKKTPAKKKATRQAVTA